MMDAMILKAVELRVNEYVSHLRGTLLDDDASDDELSTAADIYRDGLMDGIECFRDAVHGVNQEK